MGLDDTGQMTPAEILRGVFGLPEVAVTPSRVPVRLP
jgi:hypothetical protein